MVFCSEINVLRRIKICRDPEEDQEEAAEAAGLAVALAAEAEASAAEAEDLVEVTTTITDPITEVTGDRAVFTEAEVAVLAVFSE